MLRFLIAAAFALSFNVTALAQSNSKKIADHIASSVHDGNFVGVFATFGVLPLTARSNDWAYVTTDSVTPPLGIEANSGFWYFNGIAWLELRPDPDAPDVAALNFYDQTAFEFDTAAANPNPANALAGQPAGDRIIEAYSNGTAYFLRLASSWELRAFVPSAATVADLVGTDGATDGVAGLAPAPLTTDFNGLLNAEGGYTQTCALNEYFNNVAPLYLTMAHEGAGGTNLTISVDDVPASFQNLQNATDNGGGLVVFSGGANQNFNRRASTVEFIQEPNQKFTIVKPVTSAFDTQVIDLTTDPSEFADQIANDYQLVFTGTTWFLRDENNVTLATGGAENATYDIYRIYEGILLERNGVEVYRSPCEWTNYSGGSGTVTINSSTGLYQLDVDKPASPIALSANAAALTTIPTGFDFTQAEGMTFKYVLADTTGAHAWSTLEIDVDVLLSRFNQGGSVIDNSNTFFDNDYAQLNIVDPVAGDITILPVGRAMSYVKSELWITAEEEAALIPVANVALAGNSTTGVFQNLGDADTRFTGEDGAIVMLEYGGTTLDLSASEIIPAGTVITIGVEAPTAIETNYYVNVMAGYLSYERVE